LVKIPFVPEIRLAGKSVVNYPAVTLTCQTGPSKPKRCPNVDARKITRLEHEDAGQIARDIAKTKQHEASMKRRKIVARLFAQTHSGFGRLRLRGPNCANDELLVAATAQNFHKPAKILPAPPQTQKA
jgi:hypothetical protein